MFSNTDKREHLFELMKDFDSAMLVTRTESGQLRSRPMAIADLKRDGDLWFATSVESGKVHELVQDPRVSVTLQSKNTFISLTGKAMLVHDRAKVEQLWKESWKAWFPQGPNDPSLVLIKVDPEEAELWDSSGANKFKYLFQAAKALVTGTAVAPPPETNQKVRL